MRRSPGDAAPRDLIVRKYAVKGLAGWNDECEQELRRCTDLWNLLVEQHRAAQQRREATEDRDPAVRTAREALKELAAATPPDENAIKAARAALNEELKRVRKIPSTKAALQRIEIERREAATTARQKAVLDGLYWATASAILDGFTTARSSMLAKRGAGIAADLHFRRHDGGGRIVNQFTNGGLPLNAFLNRATEAGIPMTATVKNDAEPMPKTRMRRGKEETVQWRPPGEPHEIVVQAVLHRTIDSGIRQDFAGDPDVRIKSVSLVRRENKDWTRLMPPRDRFLTRDNAFVVTASAAAGSTIIDAPGREIVAVNLGWRKVPDGLRVATIVGQREDWPRLCRRPDRGMIADDSYFRVIPEAKLALPTRADELCGERDKLLAEMTPMLRRLPWADAPPAIVDLGSALAAAPKFGSRSLARLVVDWLLDAPEWQPEALAELESWRKHRDNHLRNQAKSALRHFIGWRGDWYRVLAKQISERATIVVTAVTDYSVLARIAAAGPAKAASHNRFLAANGLMMAELKRAMRARGKHVAEIGGIFTWRECQVCGRTLDVPTDIKADLHYMCRCGVTLDIDTNHCAALLRQFVEDRRAAVA